MRPPAKAGDVFFRKIERVEMVKLIPEHDDFKDLPYKEVVTVVASQEYDVLRQNVAEQVKRVLR